MQDSAPPSLIDTEAPGPLEAVVKRSSHGLQTCPVAHSGAGYGALEDSLTLGTPAEADPLASN